MDVMLVEALRNQEFVFETVKREIESSKGSVGKSLLLKLDSSSLACDKLSITSNTKRKALISKYCTREGLIAIDIRKLKTRLRSLTSFHEISQKLKRI